MDPPLIDSHGKANTSLVRHLSKGSFVDSAKCDSDLNYTTSDIYRLITCEKICHKSDGRTVDHVSNYEIEYFCLIDTLVTIVVCG